MNPDGNKASNPAPSSALPILVWDLPTRLFHWLLAALVVASFLTGKIGGGWMQYHKWIGYVVLGLLAFRIVWGFVGGRYARFSSFLRGPGVVLRYARSLLRREASQHLGHNPMGGWSVMAMLIALSVQAVTGLFANDDIFVKGPLYPWIDKATSDWLTRIHRLNQEAILLLVGVHVAAVFFYLIIKHDNLILPMITGRKHGQGDGQASANPMGRAALIACLLTIGVYLLVR